MLFRSQRVTLTGRFKGFLKDAQEAARQRYALYQQLAGITAPRPEVTADDLAPSAAPEGEES